MNESSPRPRNWRTAALLTCALVMSACGPDEQSDAVILPGETVEPEDEAMSELSASLSYGGVACFYDAGNPHISKDHAPGMMTGVVSLRCTGPVQKMYARSRLVRNGAGVAAKAATQLPPAFGQFTVNADAPCDNGLYHTEGFFTVVYRDGKTLTAQMRRPKTYDIRIGGRSWKGSSTDKSRYPSPQLACQALSSYVLSQERLRSPTTVYRNVKAGPVKCSAGGDCSSQCTWEAARCPTCGFGPAGMPVWSWSDIPVCSTN